MLSLYKQLSLFFFGWAAGRSMDSFRPLEPHLKRAKINILLKAWVSMIFFTTALMLIAASFTIYFVLTYVIEMDVFIYVFSVIFFPVFVACIVFIIFYLYPVQKENNMRNSIENNMPFAITHMAAIASSGIPVEFMFDLLTGFKEYGAISDEASLIVRNIRTFGMSSTDSIKSVIKNNPSQEFSELLSGIVSIIESGGDLIAYLDGMAERALFDYKIKREKYLKTLATYADIYTALLVAAPLMMLSLLATMSIIGGNIMGLTIQELIVLITWVVLPVTNMTYLAFIHVTYPGV